MCACVSLSIPCVCSAVELQKKVLDPLELELHVIVCSLMWYWEPNLSPLQEKQVHLLYLLSCLSRLIFVHIVTF